MTLLMSKQQRYAMRYAHFRTTKIVEWERAEGQLHAPASDGKKPARWSAPADAQKQIANAAVAARQKRQIRGTMKTATTKNQINSGRPSFQ
jgi:hypothetical protein